MVILEVLAAIEMADFQRRPDMVVASEGDMIMISWPTRRSWISTRSGWISGVCLVGKKGGRRRRWLKIGKEGESTYRCWETKHKDLTSHQHLEELAWDIDKQPKNTSSLVFDNSNTYMIGDNLPAEQLAL